jgi:hypothetical protein
LNKKVAYQANCDTRWLPEQEPWLDEILALIGVDRPPRQFAGVNAFCCSGPIISTNRELALDIQGKNIKDALDCKEDYLALPRRVFVRSDFGIGALLILKLRRG